MSLCSCTWCYYLSSLSPSLALFLSLSLCVCLSLVTPHTSLPLHSPPQLVRFFLSVGRAVFPSFSDARSCYQNRASLIRPVLEPLPLIICHSPQFLQTLLICQNTPERNLLKPPLSPADNLYSLMSSFPPSRLHIVREDLNIQSKIQDFLVVDVIVRLFGSGCYSSPIVHLSISRRFLMHWKSHFCLGRENL